jgi:Centromere protein H (CENP-H)
LFNRDLLPLLEQRDTLSVTLTDLSSKVLAAKKELVRVETEHVLTTRQNTELARQMVALAKDADTQQRDNIPRKAQKELAELDENVRTSRQRWRIMKGTASGTIVGSGVDWARDPELLKIVLDDDGADDG